jgi:DNA polymerase II small subunit
MHSFFKMGAEIKKQIINSLIENDVLVGDEILSRLESVNDEEVLKKIKSNNEYLLDKEMFASVSSKNFINDIKKEDRKVKIISSYDPKPRKRTLKDFVSFFRRRYDFLLRILSQRQELKNLVSISRIKKKQEGETISAVGMISEISITTNGHYIITIEDDTGMFKFLVSKNSQNKELKESVKNLVLDEVIGLTGTIGNNIIFANNIIIPDVPLSKEFKKSPNEEFAVFIGDLHFGSKFFLHKEFERFKKWINGDVSDKKQREIAKKVRYLFILGDMVEGVGTYPGQENDLETPDIYDQYDLFNNFVKSLPSYINVIISPGNHDAVRVAEPQPPISEEYLKELYDMENVFIVSNPAIINIGESDNFSGFDVLIYHGYSFPYYADTVPSIRENGGQERVDLVMKYLLQKRHLAPSHKSTQYIPDSMKDCLIIKKIPDFFATGHIHRATYSVYRNVSLINASTWVGMTDYQEKLGLKPEPARAIAVNLSTRDARLLNFEGKKKDE